MNNLLSLTLVFEFLGLFIPNVDLLLDGPIYHDKFLTDIFTKVFNFGYCLTYLIAVLLLYPDLRSSDPTNISGRIGSTNSLNSSNSLKRTPNESEKAKKRKSSSRSNDSVSLSEGLTRESPHALNDETVSGSLNSVEEANFSE
jgi:hypothetical protein